jgi:hypothetical protein
LNDSIFLSNKSRLQTLDSLKFLNDELTRILQNINKQEKITGRYSNIRENVKEKIAKTKQEIGEIETYNEIVEIPGNLKKGYSSYGNTSNFTFFCPTDTTSDFIDLKLKFQDESLIRKITCIYISVAEIRADGKQYLLFHQAYKPKEGVNAFKIKNYFKSSNSVLDIGYLLNSETGKEYPNLEKVTCNTDGS